MKSQKSAPSPANANANANATASAEQLRVGRLSTRELEMLMLRGETPDPERMVGWEYRGLNTGRVPGILGIRKFMKGFYKDADGQTLGYNLAVEQNPVDAPWLPRAGGPFELWKKGGEPTRFGFYVVSGVDAGSRDNAYLHALLLDYGRGKNPRFDPSAGIRDYLVRVSPGSDDLLLGKAFMAAGPLRLPVGYFVIERWRTA